jgi:hypothetical protein
VLKVTSQTDATRTTFELEGTLMGPWVQELEVCWRQAVDSNQRVRVLLCAVSFIDERGRKLLAEMYRHGAELIAEGCMNQAIVQDIMQSGEKNHE